MYNVQKVPKWHFLANVLKLIKVYKQCPKGVLKNPDEYNNMKQKNPDDLSNAFFYLVS